MESDGEIVGPATSAKSHDSDPRPRVSLDVLDQLSGTNDEADRKLWFDYIKTLNERQLQESQRAGVTTYVLLGTLVGILYRFGPHLPQFFSQPDNVKSSITVFALLVVVLVNVLSSVFGLGNYLGGESDFRALPKSSEHSFPVIYGMSLVVVAAFVSFEVWIAILSADHFQKYVLSLNALWLSLNLVVIIFWYRSRTKKTKGIKNPVPRFNVFRVPPWSNLINCVLFLIWVLLASIALIRYLKPLPKYGLQPFKAASVCLIAISILGYMFLRFLGNAGRHKYFGLERDIILNRMTPAEIRDRYLRDLSGPDMAQWLDDAVAALDLKEQHLIREQQSAQQKLSEISGINVEYRIERKERAKSAAEQLNRAIADCMSQYDVLTFQSEFFVESYKTQEEREALRQRTDALKKKFLKFKEKATSARGLLDKLIKAAE